MMVHDVGGGWRVSDACATMAQDEQHAGGHHFAQHRGVSRAGRLGPVRARSRYCANWVGMARLRRRRARVSMMGFAGRASQSGLAPHHPLTDFALDLVQELAVIGVGDHEVITYRCECRRHKLISRELK